MTQWIYLTDMAPQARIYNPESGELRNIMSSAVKHRAPAGLRRYTLNELPGGVYEETGEMVPMTSDLYDEMEEAYSGPNSWNFDWPHLEVEAAADADPSMRERVVSRLSKMMAGHPYDFQIMGLQRRYLMYYSDGSINTQQRFERLLPKPESNPFRRNGALRRKYDWIYNSVMRDAKVPYPKDKEAIFGSLRPCLYLGAAWVVRFTLDAQDVLLERCRVYVDDDANFICSDWCQRHDYSSYGHGINLQTGIYTFDGWVTGPCLIKNTESGSFKPKEVKFQRTAVRELLKKAPLAVPTFDDAFGKAKAAVDKYAKAAHSLAPAPAPTVDAGPITPEAMAEAIAEAERIIAEKAQAAAEAAAAVSPKEPTPELHRAPMREEDAINDTYGYVVSYKSLGDVEGRPVVQVTLWYSGEEYLNRREFDFDMVVGEDSFIVDDDSSTGFWYGSAYPAEDQLNTHWWLYSAAVYYKDNLMPSAVQTALLEA
jgi:hypothetical protein